MDGPEGEPLLNQQTANRSATSALVVVANRLPLQRVDGAWETSPGGLVRAMLAVLRDRDGAWVGWNGETTSNDALPGEFEPAAEIHSMARDLHDLEGIRLLPVGLSPHDFLHHYERISNGALWPLFHDAIRESIFDAESWAVYRDVNRRFAEAAAAAAAHRATVWVHDYQLLLVPSMLRELRPDVTIGFFLHIPFPPQELFMRMPWREELLNGVLGADLVGFQRSVGADNFVALAKRLIADVDHQPDEHNDHALTVPATDGAASRQVTVGTFPISIDVDEIRQLVARPETAGAVAAIRRQLGNPATVFLGVDRLDYTKGIDLRLASFGELLRERSASTTTGTGTGMGTGTGIGTGPDTVLVQIAVPGREGVESYMDERRAVEQLVGDVNGEHAAIGHPAVHYIRRTLSLADLIPLYVAADVMLVTPRRDGMNLVAKEFVAARPTDTGVLILSEFAGAADELTDAIVVNPHDPDAILAAMKQAIAMTPDEVSRRMAGLRTAVAERDVHGWARAFLRTLSWLGPLPTSPVGPSGPASESNCG